MAKIRPEEIIGDNPSTNEAGIIASYNKARSVKGVIKSALTISGGTKQHPTDEYSTQIDYAEEFLTLCAKQGVYDPDDVDHGLTVLQKARESMKFGSAANVSKVLDNYLSNGFNPYSSGDLGTFYDTIDGLATPKDIVLQSLAPNWSNKQHPVDTIRTQAEIAIDYLTKQTRKGKFNSLDAAGAVQSLQQAQTNLREDLPLPPVDELVATYAPQYASTPGVSHE